jgi:hypothetical protein
LLGSPRFSATLRLMCLLTHSPQRDAERAELNAETWKFGRIGFKLEVQQNLVALRPIRGEMFIERATVKRFLLAPAERNISRSPGQCEKHCAPAGARVVGFRVLSINISLRWSETNCTVALESCIHLLQFTAPCRGPQPLGPCPIVRAMGRSRDRS